MSFTKQLDAARVVLCDCVCVFFLLNIFSESRHLLGMLANKKMLRELPGGPVVRDSGLSAVAWDHPWSGN